MLDAGLPLADREAAYDRMVVKEKAEAKVCGSHLLILCNVVHVSSISYYTTEVELGLFRRKVPHVVVGWRQARGRRHPDETGGPWLGCTLLWARVLVLHISIIVCGSCITIYDEF